MSGVQDVWLPASDHPTQCERLVRRGEAVVGRILDSTPGKLPSAVAGRVRAEALSRSGHYYTIGMFSGFTAAVKAVLEY